MRAIELVGAIPLELAVDHIAKKVSIKKPLFIATVLRGVKKIRLILR